jgi:hypothetical protein
MHFTESERRKIENAQNSRKTCEHLNQQRILPIAEPSRVEKRKMPMFQFVICKFAS